MKQLNLWAADEGVRVMSLGSNLIRGVVLYRSFHPPVPSLNGAHNWTHKKFSRNMLTRLNITVYVYILPSIRVHKSETHQTRERVIYYNNTYSSELIPSTLEDPLNIFPLSFLISTLSSSRSSQLSVRFPFLEALDFACLLT